MSPLVLCAFLIIIRYAAGCYAYCVCFLEIYATFTCGCVGRCTEGTHQLRRTMVWNTRSRAHRPTDAP